MTRGVSYKRENRLESIRPLVVQLMMEEGRITDETICELCFEAVPNNRYDIHHTRYEGATYFDLLVVCRSCNLKKENIYLT